MKTLYEKDYDNKPDTNSKIPYGETRHTKIQSFYTPQKTIIKTKTNEDFDRPVQPQRVLISPQQPKQKAYEENQTLMNNGVKIAMVQGHYLIKGTT